MTVVTAVVTAIQAQAKWREGKAAECPEDTRNDQSARALWWLVDYVKCGEAESRSSWIIQALEQHIPDHGQSIGGREAQRELSRHGYSYEATSPAHHEELLEDLYLACMADAYEVAAGTGSDWTDALYDIEIQAALDEVHLPRRYWQLRGKSTLAELVDEIAAYRADNAEVSA